MFSANALQLKGAKGFMKFWMKVQHVNQETRKEGVVAACDENILGKKLNEHTKICEHFYKGKLVGEEELIKELERATTANIFGDNAVKAAVKSGIINAENVKEIGGVKYALLFSFY
jgi:hypothetical protein